MASIRLVQLPRVWYSSQTTINGLCSIPLAFLSRLHFTALRLVSPSCEGVPRRDLRSFIACESVDVVVVCDVLDCSGTVSDNADVDYGRRLSNSSGLPLLRRPRQVGGQAVLGRQNILPTPWLTERHGYDPTLKVLTSLLCAMS